MQRLDAIGMLIARILLSVIFLHEGYLKWVHPGGALSMIAGAGLPFPTLLTHLAGTFELAAGACILLGFQTRVAALLLAGFCVFTALVFHNVAIEIADFPDAANNLLTAFNGFMRDKNFMIAGGFIVLALHGAGAWSIDARMRR